MSDPRHQLLRTLAFHQVWGHAPTRAEWIATVEADPSCAVEGLEATIDDAVRDGTVVFSFGRYAFDAASISAIRDRETFAPRKRRISRRAAAWLASLSSVRFVALCNTTSLGHARDAGDLDFFVITRSGTIMTTRAFAALPYTLMNRRPSGAEGERDAICLSYFVSDAGLDLSSHMLDGDDPYFRYWFLSLVPLYDDGISRDLWAANSAIVSRHPFARRWIVPPDFAVRPRIRIPVPTIAEKTATRLQESRFPTAIRERMNRGTDVIVSPRALKFHVNDRREQFRSRYLELCRSRGITT